MVLVTVISLSFLVKYLVLLFLNNIYWYLFLAVLGLCCCLQAFSSCCEWELLSSCSARTYCQDFACWRAQVLGCVGFRAVAYGLSCIVQYGIFPDQGSNPCPLHWQADCQPLDHQESAWSPLFSMTTLLYYLTIISCQLLTWLDLTSWFFRIYFKLYLQNNELKAIAFCFTRG